MRVFDAEQTRAGTPWVELVDAIGNELAEGVGVSPERLVHPIAQTDGSVGSLLLKPAWRDGELVTIKTVTYMPANAGTDVPTINAIVTAFDGANGVPLAVIDGNELTSRRTAAISALAARSLARSDSSRLVIVGTGQLAPNVAQACRAVRPIETIEVWGRSEAKAAAVVADLEALGIAASVCADLEASVRAADITSCVTGSDRPLVMGEWLAPGAHLDLIGSFRPDMRESDDDAVRRSTVFVDTVAGAIVSGDLSQPIDAGWFAESDIAADLRALVVQEHPGRQADDEITFFKSAGFALADLAAARLVLEGTS